MRLLLGFTLLVAIGVATGRPALALDVGQCFYKSQQAKILSDAGQYRVVGAVQSSLAKSKSGKYSFEKIKVTYTADIEQSQGFILVESACSNPNAPASGNGSDPTVYIAATVRVTGIFNNTIEFVPSKARSNKPRDTSEAACKAMEADHLASYKSYIEILNPRYIHYLNEYTFKNSQKVFSCDPLDFILSNLRSNNEGIMYQGIIMLDNNRLGLLLSVVGKPDTSEGFVFLSDVNGSAFPAGIYEKILYLDEAPRFLRKEDLYIPDQVEREKEQYRKGLAAKWSNEETMRGNEKMTNAEAMSADKYLLDHFDEIYDKLISDGIINPAKKEEKRNLAFASYIIGRRVALGIDALD